MVGDTSTPLYVLLRACAQGGTTAFLCTPSATSKCTHGATSPSSNNYDHVLSTDGGYGLLFEQEASGRSPWVPTMPSGCSRGGCTFIAPGVSLSSPPALPRLFRVPYSCTGTWFVGVSVAGQYDFASFQLIVATGVPMPSFSRDEVAVRFDCFAVAWCHCGALWLAFVSWHEQARLSVLFRGVSQVAVTGTQVLVTWPEPILVVDDQVLCCRGVCATVSLHARGVLMRALSRLVTLSMWVPFTGHHSSTTHVPCVCHPEGRA